jgi:hypothetical protein
VTPANPPVAAALGVAVGILLLLLSRFSIRFVTPENGPLGLAVVGGSWLLALVVAGASLFAYRTWAPAALKPFGLALVAAYLVAAFVAAAIELGRRTRRS